MEFLNGELKDACDLYNSGLQHRRAAYKSHGKSINDYDQAAELKAMRLNGCLSELFLLPGRTPKTR